MLENMEIQMVDNISPINDATVDSYFDEDHDAPVKMYSFALSIYWGVCTVVTAQKHELMRTWIYLERESGKSENVLLERLQNISFLVYVQRKDIFATPYWWSEEVWGIQFMDVGLCEYGYIPFQNIIRKTPWWRSFILNEMEWSNGIGKNYICWKKAYLRNNALDDISSRRKSMHSDKPYLVRDGPSENVFSL